MSETTIKTPTAPTREETTRTPDTGTLTSTKPAVPAAGLPVSTPATDVYRTADGLVMTVDLPGVDNDDLELEIENNRLSLKAIARPVVEDGLEWLHRETRGRVFRRNVRLTDRVDTGKIKATLKHGVLALELPFKPEVLPRKITVES